jgi:hypothetical protein
MCFEPATSEYDRVLATQLAAETPPTPLPEQREPPEERMRLAA